MTKDTKVYILFGETGEYSDHVEWWVRAYLDKDQATQECDKLNALCVEAGLFNDWLKIADYAHREAALTERIKPHDANAQTGYTGLLYGVGEVVLADPPEPTP